MTYVIIERCIKCKYMDSVGVCALDCFCEGENMLVINLETASARASCIQMNP